MTPRLPVEQKCGLLEPVLESCVAQGNPPVLPGKQTNNYKMCLETLGSCYEGILGTPSSLAPFQGLDQLEDLLKNDGIGIGR